MGHDFISDDITFCANECDMISCFRNPANIKNKDIPHSFGNIKGTALCPLTNEPAELNMTAEKYFKLKGVLTEYCHIDCNKCKLNCDSGLHCYTFEIMHPREAIAIIEAWAKERLYDS